MSGVFVLVECVLDNNGNKDFFIAEPDRMLVGPEGKYRIMFDQETESTLKESDTILVVGTVYARTISTSFYYELDPVLVMSDREEIGAYLKELEQKSS